MRELTRKRVWFAEPLISATADEVRRLIAKAKAWAESLGRPVALLDWFDAAAATSIAFSASDRQAAEVARQVIASSGRYPIEIADRPGLIVMRTLAQIANAAGDAVFEHVSDENGIDQALRYGANYPFGPCAWARRLGVHALIDTLEALQSETGQTFYAPSEHWRCAG